MGIVFLDLDNKKAFETMKTIVGKPSNPLEAVKMIVGKPSNPLIGMKTIVGPLQTKKDVSKKLQGFLTHLSE